MIQGSDRWSGRGGFILATVGASVGLGSIWKFPYEVGTNGGGAFVLFYLLGLVLVVVPLMLCELAIGRRGQLDAQGSIAAVAASHGAARSWSHVGTLGVVIAFLILSFYSVIGGWALAYAIDMVSAGLPGSDANAVQQRWNDLLASPARIAAYHAVFMGMTALIVARGIEGGIEGACKVLMPLLAVLIVLLAAYAAIEGDLPATMRFLFALDGNSISPRTVLEALGLGFFSIGVGMATMITYAAYADRSINLREVAVVTIVGDTAISLLAGFAVFPIVFANHLDPSSGPGLVFVTLPLAFARMPFGGLAAVTFFVLLVIAAVASATSLLEMPVAFLRRALGLSRPFATALSACACWIAGLASVLSFNLWAHWFPLAAVPGLAQATWFDILDHLTSNMLLPIGGFTLAVFAGWALPAQFLAQELKLGKTSLAIVHGLLRYVVPAAIAAATVAPLFL